MVSDSLAESLTRPRLHTRLERVNSSVILEVRQLTKSYPNGSGSLTVVRDISFAIEAGSSCAIVGPSGSGKTTLLGLCAGLDQPTSDAGLIAERWFFFAQSNHPQNLYYQAIS